MNHPWSIHGDGMGLTLGIYSPLFSDMEFVNIHFSPSSANSSPNTPKAGRHIFG
ncbi:hypothetical protein [Marinoscillum pacificum]|uniref:hypothetical protein n=1 Tax=Marinoscillum pacificum TaxID=392723 RepID=UPI00215868BC|nr:hypothetical protein [Marinoscillum pacificum]